MHQLGLVGLVAPTTAYVVGWVAPTLVVWFPTNPQTHKPNNPNLDPSFRSQRVNLDPSFMYTLGVGIFH